LDEKSAFPDQTIARLKASNVWLNMDFANARKLRLEAATLKVLVAALLLGGASAAVAGDFRISLPKHSHVTPVQQLNREGVSEAKRGHLSKAKERFVKAYLLDPNDPFTLNNLGYVAELEGDVDRALRYYQLAAETSTEAVIDEATSKGLKGQPVVAAFQSSQASAYQTNKANFQAMALIEKGRIFEAELVLRNAIHADPQNPFLLDSLGYVMESEGDLNSALQYYSAAEAVHSDERVFLTPIKKWRGKPISEVAARSASAVREALAKGEDTETRVARLNLRGVSALNHAATGDAQKYFFDAYRLDPSNAFTLNNIGYIDELNGDRESAEMYYDAARTAEQANDRVTYSTRSDAEGRKIGSLAGTNQGDVNATLKAIQQRKRRVRRPIQLMLRGGNAAPVNEGKPQAPLGVPTPALPPAQLPERDRPPQSAPPRNDQGVTPRNDKDAPPVQPAPPSSEPPTQQPPSPQANQ
jgi:Flp pilus assembly protein TadD